MADGSDLPALISYQTRFSPPPRHQYMANIYKNVHDKFLPFQAHILLAPRLSAPISAPIRLIRSLNARHSCHACRLQRPPWRPTLAPGEKAESLQEVR